MDVIIERYLVPVLVERLTEQRRFLQVVFGPRQVGKPLRCWLR